MFIATGKKILSRLQSKDDDSAAVYTKYYHHLLDDYISQPGFKRTLGRIAATQAESGFRSLAILSERSGEGKTLFVSALALGYVLYLRKRVLIMDTVHQTADESFYFQSLLQFDDRPESTPRRGPLSAEAARGCLDLLTTRAINLQIHGTIGGRETARRTRHDASDFMIGEFLKRQYANYDLVLIDTCAMRDVGRDNLDPIVLATQTDRVIVLMSRRSMDAGTAQRLRELGQDIRIRLLGAMINDWVPPSDRGTRR